MLTKLFKGLFLKRLDNIKQWQEMDVFKSESVSQHSYKVTTFCISMLEDIFGASDDPKVLKYKLECIRHAHFHDWDESLILRDMSHETKYNDFNGQDIRNALNALSQHLVKTELNEVRPNDGTYTDSFLMMRRSVVSPLEDVKSFVKLCDWLGLIFYMKREKSLGNLSLGEQYERAIRAVRLKAAEVKQMLCNKFPNEKLSFKDLEMLLSESDFQIIE